MKDSKQNHESERKLPAQMTIFGVYALCEPGEYKEKALTFLLDKLGSMRKIIENNKDYQAHPHGIARIALSRIHWNQYCWIEKYGSLEGFSEMALDCSSRGYSSE